LTSIAPFVNIPFQQNSAFVGQHNILESLKRSFHVGLGNREASLYGLGGIGYVSSQSGVPTTELKQEIADCFAICI
jgi:hypothetical protein